MGNDIWNYVITAVGLAGFFLAGKKIWWAWYVNIANQVLWFAYGWVTEQWGFVVGTFAYTFVFVKNAVEWTREHREEVKAERLRKKYPRGQMPPISIRYNLKIDDTQFKAQMAKVREGLQKLDKSMVFAEGMQIKINPYKPKGRFCPWWFHKRFHKKGPLPVRKGIGGPKIGEVTDMGQSEDGLWITGKIDRDTPEGQATWEAMGGSNHSYSTGEDKPDRCVNKECNHIIANRAEVRPDGCGYCKPV